MDFEKYMKKCIQLAKLGETSPNPMVGCVVLDKYGNEISTGYHKKAGENHAERDALLKLKNGEEKDGTLIVNLEPCCHYGKTPPCSDLIIERGIKKVVAGMKDVNPTVAGKGFEKLRNAGIEVVENVLEDECKNLNEIFVKNQLKKLPFIALKTASTLDGKIATNSGSSKWITSQKAREHVKFLRKKYDAIMTSSATVLADDPSMIHQKKIILDRKLKTDLNSNIYQNGEIFIFNDFVQKSEGNVNFIKTPVVNEKLDLQFIFKKSFELGIMSIFVECGGKLNGECLKYSDKIYHFIAPKITGDNCSKSCFNYRNITDINECMNFEIISTDSFYPDILLTYCPILNSVT